MMWWTFASLAAVAAFLAVGAYGTNDDDDGRCFGCASGCCINNRCQSSTRPCHRIGIIVGSTIGSLVFLGCVIWACCYCCIRSNSRPRRTVVVARPGATTVTTTNSYGDAQISQNNPASAIAPPYTPAPMNPYPPPPQQQSYPSSNPYPYNGYGTGYPPAQQPQGYVGAYPPPQPQGYNAYPPSQPQGYSGGYQPAGQAYAPQPNDDDAPPPSYGDIVKDKESKA